MNPIEHEDIRPDPELAVALRSIEPDPALSEIDWELLRSSIVARAEVPLARRRSRSARLGHWTRQLVPLAAAAGVAFALFLGGPVLQERLAEPAPEALAPHITPEAAFEADLSEQEFRLLVSGRANADALLLVAVGDG